MLVDGCKTVFWGTDGHRPVSGWPSAPTWLQLLHPAWAWGSWPRRGLGLASPPVPAAASWSARQAAKAEPAMATPAPLALWPIDVRLDIRTGLWETPTCAAFFVKL